jgi:hypothetical protein
MQSLKLRMFIVVLSQSWRVPAALNRFGCVRVHLHRLTPCCCLFENISLQWFHCLKHVRFLCEFSHAEFENNAQIYPSRMVFEQSYISAFRNVTDVHQQWELLHCALNVVNSLYLFSWIWMKQWTRSFKADCDDAGFQPTTSREPQLFTQSLLSDLMQD